MRCERLCGTVLPGKSGHGSLSLPQMPGGGKLGGEGFQPNPPKTSLSPIPKLPGQCCGWGSRPKPSHFHHTCRHSTSGIARDSPQLCPNLRFQLKPELRRAARSRQPKARMHPGMGGAPRGAVGRRRPWGCCWRVPPEDPRPSRGSARPPWSGPESSRARHRQPGQGEGGAGMLAASSRPRLRSPLLSRPKSSRLQKIFVCTISWYWS